MDNATDKKEQIGSAAFAIFFKRGSLNFSMDYLAESLGMSKKTLYAYFRSKEEIVAFGVKNVFRDLEAAFAELSAPPITSAEQLKTFLEDWFKVVLNYFSNVNFADLEDLRFKIPNVWKLVNEGRQNLIQKYFFKALLSARDNGVIKKEISLDMLIQVVQVIIKNLGTPETILKFGGIRTFLEFISTVLTDGIINRP